MLVTTIRQRYPGVPNNWRGSGWLVRFGSGLFRLLTELALPAAVNGNRAALHSNLLRKGST